MVGFNELNGWDAAPGMRGRGAAWGYPHGELFVTRRSRYLVGVLSRHPIEVVATEEDGFCHGLLHVRILGVNYVITHLTPRNAADRELEAALVAARVRQVREPLSLMGDMNTLSPLDREWHTAAGLLPVLLDTPLLRRKFVSAEGAINYRPMQTLLDAGLTDLGPRGASEYSVPTAANADIAHAARMRLDYLLANPAFVALKPATRIVRDAATDALSDHYPVECVWG